jgi:hypothetical protein
MTREQEARAAYEEDVRRSPFYHDGAPRRSWDELPEFARESWRRNPTPRPYPPLGSVRAA